MPSLLRPHRQPQQQRRRPLCCFRQLSSPVSAVRHGFIYFLCAFAIASICLPMSMDAAATPISSSTTTTTVNVKTDTQSKGNISHPLPHSVNHSISCGLVIYILFVNKVSKFHYYDMKAI
uniref:Uncharacterized protein n=1 Tax=Musca domestica TaxID=7370 RepID=A0A1I8NJV5_MUSDO